MLAKIVIVAQMLLSTLTQGLWSVLNDGTRCVVVCSPPQSGLTEITMRTVTPSLSRTPSRAAQAGSQSALSPMCVSTRHSASRMRTSLS